MGNQEERLAHISTKNQGMSSVFQSATNSHDFGYPSLPMVRQQVQRLVRDVVPQMRSRREIHSPGNCLHRSHRNPQITATGYCGSSPFNRGEAHLWQKWGSRHTLLACFHTSQGGPSWTPQLHSAPMSTAMPEADWPWEHWYPFAEGAAVHLS